MDDFFHYQMLQIQQQRGLAIERKKEGWAGAAEALQQQAANGIDALHTERCMGAAYESLCSEMVDEIKGKKGVHLSDPNAAEARKAHLEKVAAKTSERLSYQVERDRRWIAKL